MTIYAHNQINIGTKEEGSVACGASCIMCAAKELGLSTEIDDKLGKLLYDAIKKGKNRESSMSGVVNCCIRQGMNCEVIVDRNNVDALTQRSKMVEGLYKEFRSDVEEAKIGLKERRDSPAFSNEDLASGERMMLVVMFFEGESPKTHWVLIRKEGGKVVVMNPDGGINGEDDGMLEWMSSGGAGGVRKITAKQDKHYAFTGIALRLTKLQKA